jgi:hypothetical protein
MPSLSSRALMAGQRASKETQNVFWADSSILIYRSRE